MRDPFVFDSRSEFCKKPFGAVPCGSEVMFHVRPLTRDGYSRCVLVARREFSGEEIRMELLPEAVDGERTRFTGVLTAPSEPELLWYHFRLIRSDGSTALLDQSGWQETGEIQSWQLTVYEKTATPLWFGGGVVYQIFPDRFCRLSLPDPAGLVGNRWVHENWNDQPVWAPDPDGEVRNRDFFGGSLNGITAKLDDLAALGVTVLYLNPIFESASNHRYNTADYLRIDPMLGTEADFAALCRCAHAHGIRVILDGVYSHTGSNSLYFDRNYTFGGNGAYCRPDSPFRSWYTFYHWPDRYNSWWGFDTLPTVNKMDDSFLNYIIRDEDSVVAHWLKLGADGFRLDVADELPDEFISLLRERIREIKPDALLLGEVWEDASNKVAYNIRRKYFTEGELDSVMNYPFRTAILDFMRGRDAGKKLRDTVMTVVENYPAQVVACNMNLLGTHDTPRILTLLGADRTPDTKAERASYRLLPRERAAGIAKLRLAALVLFTFPGSPMIYYGDEAGMEGFEDPLNRGTYPWGREDRDLLAWFTRLGALRNAYPALQSGTISWLYTAGPLLIFARQNGDQRLTTAVNASPDSHTVTLLWEGAGPTDLLTGDTLPCSGGVLHLQLPPWGCRLLL